MMLDVELGMVGIQKKTELPISSCERPLQDVTNSRTIIVLFLWDYIKDILLENYWNVVQSPGNGHCLVYSTL